MPFIYQGQVYTCVRFNDSKTKNKHYNKHVQGKPANAFGAGDMAHLNIADANAYQTFGVRFMNLGGSYHAQDFPVVTLETSKGNLARWDHNTGMFGVMTKAGILLTFHIRLDPAQFQQAVTEF